MSIARTKLYSEVWAEPMTTVAKRYDVSSNYLARVCERLGVPRPPRGYWAQRAVGVKLERPPLPEPEPGSDLEWNRDGSEPQRHPMSTAVRARRGKPSSKDRPDTHSLLVDAHQHFERVRPVRDNEYLRPYKRNVVDIFVSKEAIERAIAVANVLYLALEDTGQRVLLAPEDYRHRRTPADIREGEKSDDGYYYHHSFGRWSPARPTVTIVGDVQIGLTLFEVSERVQAEYDSKLRKYVRVEPPAQNAKSARQRMPVSQPAEWNMHWLPSGRLGLHAYALRQGVDWDRHWYEPVPGAFADLAIGIAKELGVEGAKLSRLIAELERKEAEERRVREEKRAEERRREEARMEELRKQDAENRRQLEEKRRQEELLKQQEEFVEGVRNWKFARDIREFVWTTHAILADAKMELKEGAPLGRQLRWALEHADDIDPHTALHEEIAYVREEHAKGGATRETERPGEPCSHCGRVHGADDDATAEEE